MPVGRPTQLGSNEENINLRRQRSAGVTGEAQSIGGTRVPRGKDVSSGGREWPIRGRYFASIKSLSELLKQWQKDPARSRKVRNRSGAVL